ncbi:hypothetical protein Plim_3917 [Planctopirus limnophila DSM 3776]|uniref:Uncharacterized protein n=1 Tax=Planctopirus limnophila (strain ATCC 43296 / DSM 3776 / IFAM 1008 / Mu 290) TaxID=521674 RepID=D5SXA6_PLAL2|nr:hypothetical protein [Planctopirus limnophila]ADG69728.1 hypothetical protein Plim_3917 [Planctopirus limnophila DSM 3776]
MKHALTLFALLWLTGCEETHQAQVHPLEQWVGTEVTVNFNRDLLGAAGSPIAPTSTWLNNTRLSLDGKLVAVHHDGLFLDSRYKLNSGDTEFRHSVFWIPMNSILTIEKAAVTLPLPRSVEQPQGQTRTD